MPEPVQDEHLLQGDGGPSATASSSAGARVSRKCERECLRRINHPRFVAAGLQVGVTGVGQVYLSHGTESVFSGNQSGGAVTGRSTSHAVKTASAFAGDNQNREEGGYAEGKTSEEQRPPQNQKTEQSRRAQGIVFVAEERGKRDATENERFPAAAASPERRPDAAANAPRHGPSAAAPAFRAPAVPAATGISPRAPVAQELAQVRADPAAAAHISAVSV